MTCEWETLGRGWTRKVEKAYVSKEEAKSSIWETGELFWGIIIWR
jgi:hypothetical protein